MQTHVIANNIQSICQSKLVTANCYPAGNKRAAALNVHHSPIAKGLSQQIPFNPRAHFPILVVLATDYADSNREAFAFTKDSLDHEEQAVEKEWELNPRQSD